MSKTVLQTAHLAPQGLMMYCEITPFLHVLMALFVTVSVIFVSILGSRTKRAGYQKQFSMWFGVSLLCLWIVYNIYYFLPINFRLDVSLPLHVCDILAVIAALAMIKPNRKTSALLYFCALALAGQAIITPIGNQNPLIFRFWLFWLLHAGIISASIYDLVVRKYMPVFKDFLFVVACAFIYVAIILPINIIFGWNYGYIGNQIPDTTTIIDALGVWPQRLIWMFAIIFTIQFIMYLPWKIFGGKNNERR
ncbi:MAG: TIGR02206 family membrane protein [Bacteroidales bacterium]|nr:TIGR02206 family membrane protein [Bacteroidales bacterium]